MSAFGKVFGIGLILMGLFAIIQIDNPYEESNENYPKISILEAITTVNMRGMFIPFPIMIGFGLMILFMDKECEEMKKKKRCKGNE